MEGGAALANRDHTLDDKIVRAAYEEFLSCGFRDASLHKIAEKAGVTTGAIYTRYSNKDALFSSLLQDFFGRMERFFAPCAEEYQKAERLGTTQALLDAIDFEQRAYFRLLTERRNDCVLFFCRSDGSSVEAMVKGLMRQKSEQTVSFFCRVFGKAPNADALRLLMGAQFWYFRQLLDERPEEDAFFSCLQTILDFTNAGWRQFCDALQ